MPPLDLMLVLLPRLMAPLPVVLLVALLFAQKTILLPLVCTVVEAAWLRLPVPLSRIAELAVPVIRLALTLMLPPYRLIGPEMLIALLTVRSVFDVLVALPIVRPVSVLA